MNIFLTCLNAKFIHSNLAIRYLSSYISYYSDYRPKIKIREFTINDQIEYILSSIYLEKPQIIGLSCYIWNIEETLMLARSLKKVLPDSKIILGGPEVSYDGEAVMKENPQIDYIVYGEGEVTFLKLVEALDKEKDLSKISGLIYRKNRDIVQNGPRELIKDLDTIPFPYDEELSGLENKVIYYETSRGCPFNCKYCLSSTIKGVRFFSLDRVFKEIDLFIDKGVNQVKLVDRTFNCNLERAKDIIRHILSRGGKTNFHFEIAAHIIDDEIIDLLNSAPLDLFQLEIGIQSTNEATLHAVDRKTNLETIANVVKRVREPRNVHIHLDLIAGLPYEGYESFRKSFDDVYKMGADNLQLGFLKLLKGSGLRLEEEKHGYIYTDYSPYEVLKNDYIDYGEIVKLKDIEDLLGKYSNSNRFVHSIRFLLPYFGKSAFLLLEDFAAFWREKGLFDVSHSLTTLFEIIFEYVKNIDRIPIDVFKEVLRLDYCLWQKPSRYPKCIEPKEMGNRFLSEFLDSEENINKYLPEYKGYTKRQLTRAVHTEVFKHDPISGEIKRTIVLFDYKAKSLDGTQFFKL
ncbi:MAG: B12-binding domain-containing radical SAM protein [Clostridiales bacterium]|nr:B12-binding domain-containing radical SAM protein [Clostridiales bacterium]